MNRIEDFVEFVGGHIWDADVIAGRLEELGYFSAPASIRYHGNVTGGLYEHSKAVTLELLNLTEKLGLRWGRRDSIYIVGMFHDICKTYDYSREIVREKAADGSVVCETEGKWVYNTDMLLPGHGEKSVIIAQHILGTLTQEEIMCIRWHMGAFDDRENWKYYSAAVKKYPNVLYTHVADMTVSQIIGV
jgi:hypothetical protein